jgi:hypothetical protein
MISHGKSLLASARSRSHVAPMHSGPAQNLEQKLNVAHSTGAKLRELGEQLQRLASANDSGKAERAILEMLSDKDTELELGFIARLVHEILEARVEQQSAMNAPGRATGTR